MSAIEILRQLVRLEVRGHDVVWWHSIFAEAAQATIWIHVQLERYWTRYLLGALP
jgi:hypothetical protein